MSEIEERLDIGELVAKIAAEMAKLPEFFSKLNAPANEDMIKAEMSKVQTTNEAIEKLLIILRKRLENYQRGNDLADIITQVIHIAMSTASESRYKNLKQAEQSREQRNLVFIANYDNFGKRAEEIKNRNIMALNEKLRAIYGDIYQFIPTVPTS